MNITIFLAKTKEIETVDIEFSCIGSISCETLMSITHPYIEQNEEKTEEIKATEKRLEHR